MKRLKSTSDIARTNGIVKIADTSDDYVGYDRYSLMQEQLKNIPLNKLTVIVFGLGVAIGIVEKMENVTGDSQAMPALYFTGNFTVWEQDTGAWTTYSGDDYKIGYDEGMSVEPIS